MKIFGDDGFRDVMSRGLMNKIFLNKFFYSLNYFLEKKKIKTIYIGYDTRETYKDLINIIIKNVKTSNNIKIFKYPVTTPYSNFISKKKNSFVIMITASHFKHNYNGFKFFIYGRKLSKAEERLIVKNINHKKIYNNIKKIKLSKVFFKDYENYINKLFRFKIKKNILFDYSNGSASSFIKNINFLKQSKKISYKYNGKNINLDSGSENIKKNLKKYLKKNDILIAFDGDADRVVIAKKKYGIIESEKLALIYGLYLKNIIKKFENLNKKEVIIGTNITNPWLKENISTAGIKLKLTNVGDRNVINKIKDNKALFGFETSGHFSFNNMMDGIYAAGLFLEILHKKPSLIDEVLKKKINYKKIIIGIEKNKVKKVMKMLVNLKKEQKIKYIVRKSIWESYFKLYIFYKNKRSLLHENKNFNEILFNSVKEKIKH